MDPIYGIRGISKEIVCVPVTGPSLLPWDQCSHPFQVPTVPSLGHESASVKENAEVVLMGSACLCHVMIRGVIFCSSFQFGLQNTVQI